MLRKCTARCAYRVAASSSPSSTAFTSVYVIRSAERITPLVIRAEAISPSVPISMIALITRRSSRGLSEQMPFDNSSGSIGTARSGK